MFHAVPHHVIGLVCCLTPREQRRLMDIWLLCRLFGWTKGNEILNGRWVMFGLMVGLLTEYATSVNFPDQIKLLLSYLGIADFFD